MPSRYREIDPRGVRTAPLAERKSKVTLEHLGRPSRGGDRLRDWLDGLPDLLAARDLRRLVTALESARADRRTVLWLLGGHVVKCGLTPYLVDLMDRGYVGAVAGNGSVAIHDLELAVAGHTSEVVEETLPSGSFGMWKETGEHCMRAMETGYERGWGLGESLGAHLKDLETARVESSLLAAAYARQIPVTVHVTLGADIIHQLPGARGEVIGDLSLRDFRILAASVEGLDGGGVVLNVGSAVVLPEVFVKALNLVRNLGRSASGFVAANLDMIQHYRPRVNVLSRPVGGSGEGIALTGHHEIMIPLLAGLLAP
jgi:hypothetical protein